MFCAVYSTFQPCFVFIDSLPRRPRVCLFVFECARLFVCSLVRCVSRAPWLFFFPSFFFCLTTFIVYLKMRIKRFLRLGLKSPPFSLPFAPLVVSIIRLLRFLQARIFAGLRSWCVHLRPLASLLVLRNSLLVFPRFLVEG